MGRILSVYVENEGMRVCELSKSGSTVIVKNAFEIPLRSGAVEDGIIQDVEEVAGALGAALKNNNIKGGKIAFVISSKRIANKEIVLPYMKNQKKIEEIISANVEDYFPMNNLEDYIFRHTILDTFENAEGKHFSVLVMAFQKQMVQDYYQVAETIKMPVITVDYYNNSLYQLLKKQLGQGTVLAIQMDRNVSNVSIMRGKTQLFKRSIPYGRETIIRNMAELKGLTEEEAEETLRDPQKLDQKLAPDEYSEVIRDFSSSVTRVAEFHTSRNPGTTIELVKLMGTGLDLIGLPQVLGKELGIEVIPVKELAGVKIAPNNPFGLNYEKLVDYLPCVGALIQSLDLKVEEEKKGTGSYTIFIILIVLATLSVGGTIGFLIWSASTLENEKKNLQARLNNFGTAEATYNEYLTAKQNYDVINNYYNSTKNPSEMTYQMILDLEQVMPESVGIIDISIKNGSVEMTGISDGKDALAKFVIELKKLPYVADVRVEDILDTNAELGGKTSNFNMKWQLIFPAEETEGETQTTGEEGGAQ